MSESWRPDRIGVVVTKAGSVMIGYRHLPVVLFQEDLGREPLSDAGGADAGAANAGRDLLDHFVWRGFAVMIIRGLEAQDRVRSGPLAGHFAQTSRRPCVASYRGMLRNSNGWGPWATTISR